MGAVLSALARLGAEVESPLLEGDGCVVVTMLPSAKVRSLQAQLPGLTGGEGFLEASFAGYQPVHGGSPSR
jgi:ribosomal protection tetracycline resistance protein